MATERGTPIVAASENASVRQPACFESLLGTESNEFAFVVQRQCWIYAGEILAAMFGHRQSFRLNLSSSVRRITSHWLTRETSR